jgi:hypothetical protein
VCGSHWPNCQSARFDGYDYYDHVVRSEDELDRIRSYIIANPERWQFESDNPRSVPDKDEQEFWADLEASTNVPYGSRPHTRAAG